MMRRLLSLSTVPLALAATTMVALAARPHQEPPPAWATPCNTGTQKDAQPAQLYRGETATITMVMTGTCPAYMLPVDVVFVFDKSNSMTKGSEQPPNVSTGSTTPGNAPLTPPANPGFPTQEKPRPTDEPVPPAPTGFWSESQLPVRIDGLAQLPVPSIPPKPTDDKGGTAPAPTSERGTEMKPTGIPGNDPTRDLINRGTEEPAGDEDLILAVREAILDFLDHMEPEINAGRYRVALVTFNDRARIEVELGGSRSGIGAVRSRLFSIRGGGNTRIDLGLSAAARVLYGVIYRGRTDLDHKKVAILFSDGKSDPRIAARLRTRDDVTYLTVAAGRTANLALMRDIASEREFALDLRDKKELVERTLGIVPNQRSVAFNGVTVAEHLTAGFELVPDSAVPPASRTQPDGTLEWDLPPPGVPLTITYQVRAIQAGLQSVSDRSEASWSDSVARTDTTAFPDVQIDVLELPTATATVEPTGTPPATPTETVLRPAYLPILANRSIRCVPQTQTVDVALIVDTSLSMREPTQQGGVLKLDAAIGAAHTFIELLKPNDQAAVVGFNLTATALSPLTSDRVSLHRELDRLRTLQAAGTRIDYGLEKGLAELMGNRHRATSNRAIVLVTDGRQDDPAADASARGIASMARSLGVVVWAVGIGTEVDQVLLQSVASRPETYVHSPTAEGLEVVYRDIARSIPCPG